MMPLSDGELTSMRSTIYDSLPESCVITRPNPLTDGMGGFTPQTPTAIETVPCRVDLPGRQMQSTIRVYAERIGERQLFIINVPHDSTIQESDIATVSGTTYYVIAVLADSLNIFRQALAVIHA